MHDPAVKTRAVQMRQEGRTLPEISKELCISKSTASLWLRHVVLSGDQICRIHRRKSTPNYVAGNAACRKAKAVRWASYKNDAEKTWEVCSKDPAFLFGVALYIGEGYKASMNSVGISSVDPRIIRKALNFFSRIGVPEEKIKAWVSLHPWDDAVAAAKYWSKETGIPLTRFYRPQTESPKSSKFKYKNKWPNGVLQVRAGHTESRVKLEVWMTNALAS